MHTEAQHGICNDLTFFTCSGLYQIGSSDDVLQIVCQRAGYLPHGTRLEDLRQPFLKRSEDCDDLGYPAYQASGRKEREFKDYRSLLSSSYLLRKVKQDVNISLHGVSHWSSIRDHNYIVAIDHINNYLISTTSESDVFVFRDLDTGRHLRTYMMSVSYSRRTLAISHGWIVAAKASSRIFELWRVEKELSANSSNKDVLLPVLVGLGGIDTIHTIDSCCFHFPLLAMWVMTTCQMNSYAQAGS